MNNYYPFSSRFKDRVHEIFGIREDDGSTSVVSNDISIIDRKLDLYNNEINRYNMQLAMLRNNFLDRRFEFEKLISIRNDSYGNRILPYGESLNYAYSRYTSENRGNVVFNQNEFNNIYSNLIGIYEAEQEKKN